VIGTIVSISEPIPFNNFGEDKIQRTIIREDVDGLKLECYYFDGSAKKFTKYADNCASLGHVVLIVQLAKVKYFNEKPSIGNAMFSTKIYINDNIPEIVDGYDPNKASTTIFSPPKKIVSPNDFLDGAVKKMVGNIRDSEHVFHCVVYAKIHKIHREHGWAYLGYKRRGRVAKQIESKNASSNGSKYNKNKFGGASSTRRSQWYKVIVRVIDDTGSASLLLFDDFVYKLSGVHCQTLIKYGEQHEDYFLTELNVVVGKKLLFRFNYPTDCIKNNNHIYSAKHMSDDEITINIFKKDFITEVFHDDAPISFNRTTQKTMSSLSKRQKFNLIDESSDEEFENKTITDADSNRQDTVKLEYSNTFIDGEVVIDIQHFESVSYEDTDEEDDLEDFIDDADADDDSNDDKDNNDDF
nr:replication protein A 70 kDa DNA-binding subunit B [Tanacetum cinerariifolium]